jgi:hypothetical protein
MMNVGPCPLCKGTIAISWMGGLYCESCGSIFSYSGRVIKKHHLSTPALRQHETSQGVDFGGIPVPIRGKREVR